MAQTGDAFTFKAVQFDYSFNNSDWDNASGWFASLAVSGGERNTGEMYTADGDTAIIGAGKRTPEEFTFRIVCTEGSTDPFAELRDAFEAGSDVYIRWAPRGEVSDYLRWTSAKGFLTACPPPVGEVETGDPVAIEIGFKTASVSDAVIT